MESLKSLEDLLELMDIDMKIESLLDTRGSLPELDSYKDAHSDVERIGSAIGAAKDAAGSAAKGLSKTNGELDIAAVKAAEEQNRLYAGGLSARDADYLRREVDMLYRKVSKMEDEVLEYMEAAESAEAQLVALDEERTIAEALKTNLGDSIRTQWQTIDKELEVKEDRKRTTIDLVDPYLIEMYDELRASRKGRVVGRLSDDTCGSCHLRLSAAEVSQAQKQDPPRCIHCRSILVS